MGDWGKYSRKREAILSKIKSTDAHPSAEWVYHQLKPEYPALSLGTVYRNIAQLKDDGYIVRIDTVDGQERLDWRTESHPHFVCDCCKAVIDVEADFPGEALGAALEKRIGAAVERHELLFKGKCAACLKEEKVNLV